MLAYWNDIKTSVICGTVAVLLVVSKETELFITSGL
jgi:hypothetical protein